MRERLLVTEWRLPATVQEVSDILSDAERLPDWWGAVYLAVEIVAEGDADGIGRTVRFHTRGRLPYSLRWQGEVIRADRPHGWTIRATGDLAGQGDWSLRQRGDVAEVRYDWRVSVGKPVLRQLAPLHWPVFAANHRWAMARGYEGLLAELERWRAPGAPAA